MALPPTTLEALLKEAPFLRALARGLVRGDTAAEDLEQETWARALRSPPRHGGSLRAWLATVARNLKRTASRREERRAAREQAAAGEEPVPSPVEILAYQEQLARVAEAVRQLPEPCRLAVHLRYHEELAPPEIARRLGEPVDTIKSRLKRALQLLRERLDREHGGMREGWCLALAPFLAATPKAAGVAALGSLVAGGAVMSLKAKGILAGGALVFGLVLWGAWSGVLSPSAAGGDGDSGGVLVAMAGGKGPASRPLPPPEEPEPPARRELPPPGWRLEGRVVDLVRRDPIGQFELRLQGRSAEDRLETICARPISNPEGRFALELDPPPELRGRPCRLTIRATGHRPETREDLFAKGLREEGLEIALDPGWTIRGRVVDRGSGEPVAGALVLGVSAAGISLEDYLEARPFCPATDSQGRFLLGGLERTVQKIVALHPDSTEGAAEVNPKTEGEVEVRVGTGYRCHGRALDDLGRPAPGLLIALWSIRLVCPRVATTGPDGAYRTPPAEEGWYILKAEPPEDRRTDSAFTPERKRVHLVDRDEKVLFGPEPGQILWKGTLFGADGKPLPSARILLMEARPPAMETTILRDAATDAQGRFVFRKLPPAEWLATARLPGQKSSAKLGRTVLDTPGVIERDLCLPRTIVRGVVVAAGEAPPAQGTAQGEVRAIAPGEKTPAGTVRLQVGGEFLLQGLPPGRYLLRAAVPGFFTRSEREWAVFEGKPLEGIRLEIAPAGELRLEFTGFEEVETQSFELRLEPAGGGQGHGSSGRLRRGRPSPDLETFWLEPGMWRIQAIFHRLGELTREVEVAPAAPCTVRFNRREFEAAAGSLSLAGLLVRPDQSPVAGATISLRPRQLFQSKWGPGIRSAKTDDKGRVSVAGLGPGGWLVKGSLGDGAEFALPDLEIPQGAVHPFPVRWLLPAGRIKVRLVDGTTGLPFSSRGPAYWACLHREGSREILHSLASRPWGPEFEFIGVSAGRYSIRICAPGFRETVTEVFALAEGKDLDLGEVRLEAAGILELEAVDEGGKPYHGALFLWPADSGFPVVEEERGGAGRFLFDRLLPGWGKWRVHGPGIQPQELEVELKAGEKTFRRLVVRR